MKRKRKQASPISSNFAAVVALVDDGRRLRQCLDSLRWVPRILVVARNEYADIRALAEACGGTWLVARDCGISLWEYGWAESKAEWALLVKSNEVATGQLRATLAEAMRTPPPKPTAFLLPRTTVYLRKQLKYPLESLLEESSVLLFNNAQGRSLKSIPGVSGEFSGELIHYGAETLTEAWHDSMARASADAEVMASALSVTTAAQAARWGATALVKTLCNALGTQWAFKEGFEGIVWTLAELNRALLGHLYCHEKYIRGGALLRQNLPRVNKALIIKLREVGDNILLTPLLSNFRKAFPRVSVSVLSYHYSKSVLENNPAVDRLYGVSKNPSSDEERALIRNLNREGFDLIANLHAGKLSSRLLKSLNAEHKLNHHYIGKSRNYTVMIPASDRYRSSIERDLDLLRTLGVAPKSVKTEIHLTAGETDWARKEIESLHFDPRKPLVVVHPTSANEAKEWGMERFGRLIRLLVENTDAQVLVICSPSEYPRVEPLFPRAPRVQISHRADLRQMLALIREADLVVDNDSSPSHVAAAFGIPAVVLIGQTIREIFRPYDEENDRHYIFHRDVDCRECGLTRCDDRICLDFLPEEVFQKCAEILRGISKNRGA